MPLLGHSIIAGEDVEGHAGSAFAQAPATSTALEPAFTLLDEAQVADAVGTAAAAFADYRATSPVARAAFLEAVAEEIEADGGEIVQRAVLESGLTTARLTGELARTCGQLRMFAAVVRRADHRGVRVDPALPDRAPLPRPDLRVRQVPLGPVVVFGASNFPLAFSTAGGDTASALAAGCPVVVKAHPAHPGTSELVARAVARASARTGMPPGVFSLVHGAGTEVGRQLVTDPRVKAVGFTGSRAGGLALVAAAAARAEPIPVYAEMSSVNPVVILPGALSGAAGVVTALAAGYLASLTGSAGQLCTKPGLLFLPAGPIGDAFVAGIAATQTGMPGTTMLTSGIRAAYDRGVGRLARSAGVSTVATGTNGGGANAPASVVASTDLATFGADPELADEVFGAAGLVVRYDPAGAEGVDRLRDTLAGLEGQLTATLRLDPASEDDLRIARILLPALEDRAGRVLVNGWPTGVEVTHAMVHGGPFPATSDSRTTSVGSLAIERFQRPVCYQDLPDALLPEDLRSDNPWDVPRSIDGARP
ncbi:aldehyde dehydrogenase (NADP(+)) [Lapillicoccus sp.]|uniref:aldehyde dehydrogenase (NADP(+)) n=1 Tax=Lapillicoccus sp. TaxID=1909287 RepID=UPI0025D0C488|nr:aldehyde dehydrogenase (NADP(+)) [Lapillicoccus sp.]